MSPFAIRTVVSAVILCMSGCYLSHGRAGDGGGSDGSASADGSTSTSDGGTVPDAVVDAGDAEPPCPPESIGGYLCGLPAFVFSTHRLTAAAEIVAVAKRDTSLAVLIADDPSLGLGWSLLSLETDGTNLRRGDLSVSELPVATRPVITVGAKLVPTADGWEAILAVAYDDDDEMTTIWLMGTLRIRWDREGVLLGFDVIPDVAGPIPRCRSCLGTVFAAGGDYVSSLAFNGRIEAAINPAASPTEFEPAELRPLPDDHPGHTPLSGEASTTGAWIFAGGGTRVGSEPRLGFVMTRQPDGAITSSLLPGRALDPPPLVARSIDDGFVAFRYLINPVDLFDSAMHVFPFDADGSPRRATRIPTAGAPSPLAAFAGSDGPNGGFVVWSERIAGSDTDIHVRLLPEASRDACGALDVPPAIRVPDAAATPTVAALWDPDRGWFVFALSGDLVGSTPKRPGRGVLMTFTIPACDAMTRP